MSAILGKSEISFTLTLSDNMMLTRYDAETGNSIGVFKGRSADIGQDKAPGRGTEKKVAALKHEGRGFWLVPGSLPWSLVTTWH